MFAVSRCMLVRHGVTYPLAPQNAIPIALPSLVRQEQAANPASILPFPPETQRQARLPSTCNQAMTESPKIT